MIYYKSQPRVDNILWLTKLARPFPVTAGQIMKIAQKWKFSSNTLEFLKQFPEDETFKNSDDFLARCETLEELLFEEHLAAAKNSPHALV